jgi:hypothetical protein
MSIESCSICGTPIILGAKSRWLPDGSIRLYKIPSTRVFFADCDEVLHLFRELGGQLGVHGPGYLQEGARLFSRRYMGAFLGFFRGHGATVPTPGGPEIYRILLDHLRIWGLGAAELLEYGEDHTLGMRLEDPVDPELLCGYVAGAAEVTEGRRADCSCELMGDAQELRLVLADPLVEAETADAEVDFGEIKGVIEYSCCPECGVPLQVSRLDWDTQRGLIRDLVTGRRLALLGTEVVSAALKRMSEELGEHVYPRVVEAERDYARDVLYPLLHASKDPQEMRMLFGALGHGDITAEEGDRLVLRVRRPFQPHFMAGRVLGLYEGWRGERVAASWRISEWGTAYVTIYN